jgi:hypothetical protein
MKHTLLFLILLNLGLLAFGQSEGKVQFDYASFNLKDSIAPNLLFNQVVQQINRQCDTDVKKLCLVAGWMYKNIDFDVVKFDKGGSIPDYRVVFNSRKGICGDYTSLFYQFCKQLHITCEIIEGYVPEFNSENRIYVETNHAWNVVKIGDDWYHCDLLGFSGYLKQSSRHDYQFVKQLNINEFLARGLHFIAAHIPADPMWQLSDHPIPMETLLKDGKHSKSDTATVNFGYQKKINSYLKMGAVQKQLAFADNAYAYNKHNRNAIVVNYYNASVDLINHSKGDKNKLLTARKYLNRARLFVGKAANGVEKLSRDIDESLAIVNKYLK